jgi:23S rRNA (pseudouridine1915-N3)-methyltransferase
MSIMILAVDKKPGAWIDKSVQHYQHLIPEPMRFKLHTINTAPRQKKANKQTWLTTEAQHIQTALPEKAYTIALEPRGTMHNSPHFAEQVNLAYHHHQHVAFIIGGPDGLDPKFSQQCQHQWALSPWTLSHGLTRVVLAEQLFRAWAILNNHPFSQH